MSFPLIAIVGPTAVGKSQLALKLALNLCGEVINADSRQVYRHMDIGTAKPSSSMRSQAPHYLIDIIPPDGNFSLGQFKGLAGQAIINVKAKGCFPLLVGGTGQYVWALLEGWTVPEVAPDNLLREALEEKARSEGPSALYQQLSQIDPDGASRIDPTNVRRVIRALEIYHQTGIPASKQQKKMTPPWETLIIGLTLPRAALYRRADERVDAMIEVGWADEVRRLLDLGYKSDLPSMSGLGYKEMIAYVKGDLSLSEAVQRIKWNTHRFIRHQYAWFRPNDPRIHWLNADEDAENHALQLVKEKFPDLHPICATI